MKFLPTILLTFAALVVSASPAFARYSTSCVIEDGKAKGYVHSDESLSFSGRVDFAMYDDDGDLVDSDWEIAVVVLAGSGTEFVEDTDAPDDATTCTLDISGAVGDEPNDPNNRPGYRTTCEVVGGKAKGYVITEGSLSFSGRVYFKMFDEDWDLTDEDWEIAVVTVVGADKEFVEETNAPSDAKYCTLDISEAVGH